MSLSIRGVMKEVQMLKIEIAGISMAYKNAAELQVRAQEALTGVRSRRLTLEEERKLLRQREKALERFLGNPAKIKPNEKSGGSNAN
jgi:hypothetical protein